MEFIREGLNLPVPFNVIPMPALLLCLLKKALLCCFGSPAKSAASEQIELPRKEAAKPSPGGGTRSSLGANELTYKKVMGRVVKRFLLHNNRENEEVHESSFDELKQDVQMVRFEVLANLKLNKQDTLKHMALLHSGLSVLGDLVLHKAANPELALAFRGFQSFEGQRSPSPARPALSNCLSVCIGELRAISNEAQQNAVHRGPACDKKSASSGQSEEPVGRSMELLAGDQVRLRTSSFSDLNAIKDEAEESEDHEIRVPYLT